MKSNEESASTGRADGQARLAAASKLGLSRHGDETKVTGESILASLGGWIGVLESMVPGTAFVTVFTISRDMVVAIVVASLLALGFIARQIIKKRPLTQSIAGLIGIAIAAYLPLRPGGQDSDYFIPGFITNFSYLTVLAFSVLIRWPLIGVLVTLFKGNGFGWRSDKKQLRRFSAATMLWVGLFSLRLLIQFPIFLAGDVATLAVVKLAMGTPLYALTIWLSWLSIRAVFKKDALVA